MNWYNPEELFIQLSLLRKNMISTSILWKTWFVWKLIYYFRISKYCFLPVWLQPPSELKIFEYSESPNGLPLGNEQKVSLPPLPPPFPVFQVPEPDIWLWDNTNSVKKTILLKGPGSWSSQKLLKKKIHIY